jgi:hypothetical protein
MSQTMQTRAVLASFAFCALAAVGGSACLDDKGAEVPDGGPPTVFIAQTEDFMNYEDWTSFNEDDAHGEGAGTTTVFLKYVYEMPPRGATSFPVGTIVVKTMQATDGSMFSIHAMAKRGNGFNSGGARGWEFFELALSPQGVPFYLWRGVNPPTGDQYRAILSKNNVEASTPELKCNDCHASSNFRDGTSGHVAELIEAHDE